MNDALSNGRHQMAGIYQRAGEVNGQPSWISSSSALWYNVNVLHTESDWMIGPLEYIGKDRGGISSHGGKLMSSCPYNVPKDTWKYTSTTFKWIFADANDFSIECLTGIIELFVLLFYLYPQNHI